jgi:hypothetical protein
VGAGEPRPSAELDHRMRLEYFEGSHFFTIADGNITLRYYLSGNRWSEFEDEEWLEIHNSLNFWGRNCPRNWIMG